LNFCQQFSVAGPKTRVLTLLHIAQSVPSGFRYRDQSEDITCDVPCLARAAQKSNLVPSVPGNTTNPISSENVLIIQRGPEFERPMQREVLHVWCSPRSLACKSCGRSMNDCVCIAVRYHKCFLYQYQRKSLLHAVLNLYAVIFSLEHTSRIFFFTRKFIH